MSMIDSNSADAKTMLIAGIEALPKLPCATKRHQVVHIDIGCYESAISCDTVFDLLVQFIVSLGAHPCPVCGGQ